MALSRVAEGVRVHESACIQSNAVVVDGAAGVLLVDPGITAHELSSLAAGVGAPVAVAFSTHPHWDHVLWHPDLGGATRYATSAGAAALRTLLARPDWQELVAEGLPPDFANEIPMDGLGMVTGLPDGTERVPWDGPATRILEHSAHTAGHAALLVEDRGVLIAGDMLSDVLVPMLDPRAATPLEDYLAALDLLETVASRVDVVVPGHGSVGDAADLRVRLDRDRAYVQALLSGDEVDDPRIGPSPKPGWEWVRDVHEWQRRRLDASER